jgi:hypothetical protein
MFLFDFVNSAGNARGCANFNCIILSSYPMYFVNQMGFVNWLTDSRVQFYVLGRICQLCGDSEGYVNFNYIILSSHPMYFVNHRVFVNCLTVNQVDGFHVSCLLIMCNI